MSCRTLAAQQRRFANAVRDMGSDAQPEGVDAAQLALYRRLFFNNIRSCLDNAFPVLAEVLPAPLWQCLQHDFYRDWRCSNPAFAQLPGEFVQWLATRPGCGSGEPAYLVELAQWEWAELQALMAEDICVPGLGLRVNPSAQIQLLHYPVQHISAQNPHVEPLPQPQFLCVYRDREHALQFLELSAFAAQLLQQLQRAPLVTVAEMLAALGLAADAALLAQAESFLQQMRDGGIVLGTAAGQGELA